MDLYSYKKYIYPNLFKLTIHNLLHKNYRWKYTIHTAINIFPHAILILFTQRFAANICGGETVWKKNLSLHKLTNIQTFARHIKEVSICNNKQLMAGCVNINYDASLVMCYGSELVLFYILIVCYIGFVCWFMLCVYVVWLSSIYFLCL